MPPLVRSLPHVESLFLFREEESQEEAEARETLDLMYREASSYPEQPPPVRDIRIEETREPLAEMERMESFALPPETITTPDPLSRRLSHSAIEQLDDRNGISRHLAFASVPSNSLRPPPESILGKNTAPINVPQTSALRLHPISITTIVDKEEDEGMPVINLDSDSDGD